MPTPEQVYYSSVPHAFHGLVAGAGACELCGHLRRNPVHTDGYARALRGER